MRTRFLIVDDSDLVRNGLRTVLQANPEWEVCGEAADGLAAVEIFKEVRPTVVIVDFQMPGMSGIELAKRLERLNAGVRIVLMSGYSSDEVKRVVGETASQYRCMWKPLDPRTLVPMIKNALDGEPLKDVLVDRSRKAGC